MVLEVARRGIVVVDAAPVVAGVLARDVRYYEPGGRLFRAGRLRYEEAHSLSETLLVPPVASRAAPSHVQAVKRKPRRYLLFNKARVLRLSRQHAPPVVENKVKH